MADRTDELRRTAAQCLALSRSTIDPQTRVALLVMAQKLYDMASDHPGDLKRSCKSSTISRCSHSIEATAGDAATAANPAEERRRIGPPVVGSFELPQFAQPPSGSAYLSAR
jgi:hypothetical protein